MGAYELTAKVRKLKELEAMQDELAAEIEAVKDTIKAEMTAKGTEQLAVDVFTVRWTTYTSKRFDQAAFKATHGELYSQYSKPTTTRRFSVA